MPNVKGATREERDRAREALRRQRRLQHARERAEQASHSGHEMVVEACATAKATSRRLTETGQRLLAQAVALAIETVDTPQHQRNVR